MLLVAPGRAARPHDRPLAMRGVRLPPPPAGTVDDCPFCPGAEHETPPHTWIDEDPDGAWRVRIVPNRYPLLGPRDGVHEVIVNAARHVVAFWDLADHEVVRAVRAWIARERTVAGGPGMARTIVFLNQGTPAGASRSHTHAQLMGLHTDPPQGSARDAAFARGCPVCDDLRTGTAMVADTDGLVAWCPATPAVTGTIRIAPRRHHAAWATSDAVALAPLLAVLMRAQAAVTGTDAANLWVVHPASPHTDHHWHLDLVARVGTAAGLELGLGVLPLVHEPARHAAALVAAAHASR